MVPQLHDMRTVCSFRAATPVWVTITFPFTKAIELVIPVRWGIQAKFKSLLLVGSASPVPCVLNKHYFSRGGPINVSFMDFT